jgi:hypothetical protein
MTFDYALEPDHKLRKELGMLLGRIKKDSHKSHKSSSRTRGGARKTVHKGRKSSRKGRKSSRK